LECNYFQCLFLSILYPLCYLLKFVEFQELGYDALVIEKLLFSAAVGCAVMTYGFIFFLAKFDFKGSFAKLPTKLGLLTVDYFTHIKKDF
jgi:hypothetical protein